MMGSKSQPMPVIFAFFITQLPEWCQRDLVPAQQRLSRMQRMNIISSSTLLRK